MTSDHEPRTGSPQPVYSPSRLNEEVRQLLEGGLPLLWIEGEIANLARPRSGHLYFTLRDAHAQVRCALFRNRGRNLRFTPRDGQQVLARVKVTLYAPRGDFQIIVEHMEEAGDGALRRAFEALRARLQGEGLFDAERKRPIPVPPRRLGLITSPAGAAVRDVLKVLRRRYPALPVLIFPVPVQGPDAAGEIAAAIRRAGARGDVDLLMLTRGGGSLEDLQAFNEEALARAIAECPVPVVSAVGHEVDVTIADLAADYRAATPSAGAEAVSPDGEQLARLLTTLTSRLAAGQRRGLTHSRERLAGASRRLQTQHPGRQLQLRGQRLDELEQRLLQALRRRLDNIRRRLGEANSRLNRQDPIRQSRARQERITEHRQRVTAAMRHRLTWHDEQLRGLARTMESVSPLATVARGYAVITRADTGEVLRRARDSSVGETISAQLAEGALICSVTEIKSNP